MMQLATVGADGRPWVLQRVVLQLTKTTQRILVFSDYPTSFLKILQNSHVAAMICLPRGGGRRAEIIRKGTAKVLTRPTGRLLLP